LRRRISATRAKGIQRRDSSGDYVDAALVARDWRDGGQAGNSIAARMTSNAGWQDESMVVVIESASA